VGKDEASIPDEEWERFLREAEAGTGDAPREPSARARMVARRLAEDPGGRSEPWRGGPPARRKARKGWYAVALLAVVALAVVAVAPGRVPDWFHGGSGGDDGGTPLAAESQRPSAPPPTEAAAEQPTLQQPFRGSPAARWANGTAGIGMPEARATGWMSKAQVARTLEKSRDFLAASSLDPAVLRGERPAKAIALINPHQSDIQDYLKTAFRAPDRKNDPLLMFSRFDATKVRLVGDVVKTRGRMTYREGKRGAVEVTTDVTYVYPVVRAAPGNREVARTIVRREIVMSWDDPAKVITEPGTFSVISYTADATNGGCGSTHTGYYIPEFSADRATATPGDGPEVDPYDRSTTMKERMKQFDDAGCGRATRT
jgi:hypothetical protein